MSTDSKNTPNGTDAPKPAATSKPADTPAEVAADAASKEAPLKTIGAATAPPPPKPSPRPSVPPPSPAFTVPTYSLPEPASQDWLTRTRTWIEEHPALAVTAAVGVGLTLGRVLSGAFKTPPPPTLTERVEARARELGGEISKRSHTAASVASVKSREAAARSRELADDAGDVLRERFQEASEKFGDVAEVAAERAEEGYEKAKDFADVVADAVKTAVLGVVAKKADDWFDKLKR